MNKKIRCEVLWLAGCLITAYLCYVLIAGGSALDINMHDTYLAGGLFGPNLSSAYFVFSYFVTIGFGVYLIRTLFFNFKVILTDIILLIFTGLVLCFFNEFLFVIHPPVLNSPAIDNTAPVKGLFYGGDLNSYLWGIHIIKMLLIVLLTFTGFMLGRKWDKGNVK
ncbi:hypothetical protein [Mucilaginibacter gotjawali]|uniref:Uncharacterized protein n=2 Tax=Mucilaginibacter gotjawali TaxID=1550579 RepID=A0A0X8X5H3_9SPHI|nr:hypothetical protein [Mucilaginibacter gotjawali]MBB3056919.1 hypothetical protein [Mucilaginibacter gotjawali]BAU55999.1 hypothetical protein MgSA37_04191 [Mucilaginibacter gotjawali]